MPRFRYKARGPGGQAMEGHLEADNRDAVAGQLLGNGILPLEITEAPPETDALAPLKKLFASEVDIDDLILFSRQMYTLTKAGVPMIRAIRGLAESQRKPAMVETLNDIIDKLEGGRDLGGCLALHPKIFPPLFINIVRVGENTGALDAAFVQLSQYLALDKETRDRIKAALRYPSFVIAAISIAMVILNIFVIPAFANVFKRFGSELPVPTQVLIATSNFFVAYWPHVLAVVVGILFGLRQYVRTDAGETVWDRYKLKLPVVGDIIRRALLARFARSFSMAVKAGVPLVQSLTVTARAVDNRFVGGHILDMRNGIERGDSLTRTAAATGMFTPLVLQMMAVGEETGAIDDLMREVAEFYEREVDYDIKNLTSAIEPILTAVIGVMVLILALGIFLPMWDLGKAAMGR